MGNKVIEALSLVTRKTEKIRPDIYLLNFRVVNAYFLVADSGKWILVDTGLENSDGYILREANEIFGKRPECIVLTHGHFDHMGSLKALTQEWDVPAFIHANELPYITGKRDYPLPDKNESSGFVTKMSETFPHTSIDIGDYAKPLPDDHSVPFAQRWKWIFTPGHTWGHVSLFRDPDRTLIAGDAISTVKQGSLWSVISQRKELCGPPAYLTENFGKADESIGRLLLMEPSLILPSHGRPLSEHELSGLRSE